MKTRQGFVSNSSSSSFCIYGKEFYEGDLQINPDDLEVKASDVGLDFHYGPPYSDSFYIGRDMTSIKDEETGAEFKKSVIEKLTSLGINDPEKCRFIEMGWYDG